ncbi:Thiouridylase, cytoplasmic, subunit 2 [Penicillium griseofulvum]|uniref:Cytoplasmic tRNA 2-thiolation protein 2 n=1 Tax=Penicillium patulum TaxID=5078 RepID=A0A135LEJ6_PENPA|nr:Thiouridylase, cytoplasmic, subunit 2 [Penicillium griseofulvum]KXG47386.1 Thiouridylase, cytoplasmic, subunit 2 [Penicillium griseofulvum]
MPAKELNKPCMECKDAEFELTVRKRQLCSLCFRRFIAHKVQSRLSVYRAFGLDGPKHQLLLPASLGVSSSVLLHILNSDREHRLSNGRPLGYDFKILVIEPSTIAATGVSFDQNYEALRKHVPAHNITRLPFHSIFDYVPEVKEIMQEYAGSKFIDDSTLSNEERLATFRASISTSTSRTDVDTVLLTRLVVEFAKKSGCESVMWGDSDSRLAAKALAGVAKGRGASLTWQVSDGMSPWGVRFEYPLRDLFKAELLQYASVCAELSDIIIPDQPPSENVLTKNLSIDELMLRYVQNQGAKYPGVMANVARTANKLNPSTSDSAPTCALCGSLLGNVKGNSGVTVANQAEDNHSSQFCYGCMRSRPEELC